MKTKTVVGIALILFILIVGNILTWGLLPTTKIDTVPISTTVPVATTEAITQPQNQVVQSAQPPTNNVNSNIVIVPNQPQSSTVIAPKIINRRTRAS